MDKVIIGVDPHKRSVSIEARDGHPQDSYIDFRRGGAPERLIGARNARTVGACRLHQTRRISACFRWVIGHPEQPLGGLVSRRPFGAATA
jgi:hypothetical protein